MNHAPNVLPPNEEFWDASSPREARSRLVEALRFELLGPATPDEVLHESPITRYTTGMLAPFGTDVPEIEDEDAPTAEDGGDDGVGAADAGPPVSQALTPASIGLSFLVSSRDRSLLVEASWGDYRVEEAEEPPTTDGAQDPSLEGSDRRSDGREARRRPGSQWVRTDRRPVAVRIVLEPDRGLIRERVTNGDEVYVEHLSRVLGDRLAVSIFLVNRRARGSAARPPVDRWLFQPVLMITSTNVTGAFLPRELEPSLAQSDRDRESNRLLFRNRREFAIGHGCSAAWRITNDEAQVASEIRSEILPRFELPRVVPLEISGGGLDMAVLAGVESGEALRQLLSPLIDGYGAWIKKRGGEIDALSNDLRTTAAQHLDDCASALGRMKSGVDRLAADPAALRAFAFANRVMLLQRSHTVWSRERRRDPLTAPSQPEFEARWRPFQLAFVLLNVTGLVDPISDDRQLADLLWFPTGGGKTEAYLGIAAFAMALRRQRNLGSLRGDAGLCVLMRYTLRLLTLQQFQRAATMLCACESVRRRDPERWGHARFSIGLWMGQDGTPNSHDESRSSLLRVQNDPSEEGANPCQLESCPWCGEILTPLNYWIDSDAVRTRVSCPRKECEFARSANPQGIPVLVVDEEIYRECPSMLLATVDKFAQMPWNGDLKCLFGLVDSECDACGFLSSATEHRPHARAAVVHETERLAPLDLIIQDELHLISGPLGTLVGLYETAIDFLSTRRVQGVTVRPKIIASTATARRAFEQIRSLFDRELRVFPPPGLVPEDSFFAIERKTTDDSPGRLYLGLSAPGKSMKTAYVRVAAALLSSGAGLQSRSTFAEPYLTLVSYFNSLRELGGAIRLLDDDIPGRLGQLTSLGMPRRSRPVYRELTSRVRQEDIPRLLHELETRHDAPRTDEDPLPLDAVLASNMIAVGVDIDRLGLMTVTGQPKTTAEYIQATSRVGRQAWGPGLVVVIYNWSRPRDLSHYERFRHYHATLYRNVEAVSATPFSARALDRGIRGAYVAMNRLSMDLWSPEHAANQFDPEESQVSHVFEAFVRRAEKVADKRTADEVRDALKALTDEWWSLCASPLRYGWRPRDSQQMPDRDVLLRVPAGGQVGHWPAPQSLREVEEVSRVRVLGFGGD